MAGATGATPLANLRTGTQTFETGKPVFVSLSGSRADRSWANDLYPEAWSRFNSYGLQHVKGTIPYAYCMQRKDIGKRLADGVSAKLEFDYVCERGHSFGEYHLHGVMNEILSAIISPKDFIPHSGYAHEALTRSGQKTTGRQREVDFFIRAHKSGSVDVCIEAKWAGSSYCTWDRILLTYVDSP